MISMIRVPPSQNVKKNKTFPLGVGEAFIAHWLERHVPRRHIFHLAHEVCQASVRIVNHSARSDETCRGGKKKTESRDTEIVAGKEGKKKENARI